MGYLMSIYTNLSQLVAPLVSKGLSYFGFNITASKYAENKVGAYIKKELPEHIKTATTVGTILSTLQPSMGIVPLVRMALNQGNLNQRIQDVKSLAITPLRAFRMAKDIHWLNGVSNGDLNTNAVKLDDIKLDNEFGSFTDLSPGL